VPERDDPRDRTSGQLHRHDRRAPAAVRARLGELDGSAVALPQQKTGSRRPGSRQMISVRACATVNAEAATKDWFYPLFARRLSPAAPAQFRALLDSSNRVIFECRPVGAWTSHDSRRLPGDGRGGR
jgi:hypothetical protein